MTKPEGLCARCANPGRCCSGLTLSIMDKDTALEMLTDLASLDGYAPDLGRAEIGVPFMPLYQSPAGRWRLWCGNLDRAGRCSDYENRPYACRSYPPPPGHDALCVMHCEPGAALLNPSSGGPKET